MINVISLCWGACCGSVVSLNTFETGLQQSRNTRISNCNEDHVSNESGDEDEDDYEEEQDDDEDKDEDKGEPEEMKCKEMENKTLHITEPIVKEDTPLDTNKKEPKQSKARSSNSNYEQEESKQSDDIQGTKR